MLCDRLGRGIGLYVDNRGALAGLGCVRVIGVRCRRWDMVPILGCILGIGIWSGISLHHRHRDIVPVFRCIISIRIWSRDFVVSPTSGYGTDIGLHRRHRDIVPALGYITDIRIWSRHFIASDRPFFRIERRCSIGALLINFSRYLIKPVHCMYSMLPDRR